MIRESKLILVQIYKTVWVKSEKFQITSQPQETKRLLKTICQAWRHIKSICIWKYWLDSKSLRINVEKLSMRAKSMRWFSSLPTENQSIRYLKTVSKLISSYSNSLKGRQNEKCLMMIKTFLKSISQRSTNQCYFPQQSISSLNIRIEWSQSGIVQSSLIQFLNVLHGSWATSLKALLSKYMLLQALNLLSKVLTNKKNLKITRISSWNLSKYCLRKSKLDS